MARKQFWYDTEFLEDGRTIELISIGIVDSDGREYYAVNSAVEDGAFKDRIRHHDWLMKNAVPHLPLARDGIWSFTPPSNEKPMFNLDMKSVLVKPEWLIANEVREFLKVPMGDPIPALWSNCGAYDHVVLMQLWGPMVAKPSFLPMWTHDIQQERERLNVDWADMPLPPDNAHDALADARHHRAMYDRLVEIEYGPLNTPSVISEQKIGGYSGARPASTMGPPPSTPSATSRKG